MKVDENGRVYACTGERESILNYALIMTLLTECNADLEARAKQIGNGTLRDMRMLHSVAVKVFERMIESLPEEQIIWIRKQIAGLTFTSGVTNTVSYRGDKKYGLFLCYDDLNALLNAAHDHCMMCEHKGKQIKDCVIKRALDKLGNDVEHRNGECGYAEVPVWTVKED